MKEFIVLKLGGSILTEKKGRGRIRVSFIRDFSRVFFRVWREHFSKRGVGIVLLHGAGSVGHSLVRRYGLLHTSLNKQTIRGYGDVVGSMKALTSHFSQALWNEGVPVVPLQSSIFFRPEPQDRAVFREETFRILLSILRAGGIPVLGGDLGLGRRGEIRVLSADYIAVALGKRLRPVRLLFATDVLGVYKNFPPNAGDVPVSTLTRSDARSLISGKRRVLRASFCDVTGEMGGKLYSLLALHGCSARIFDGRSPRDIRRVLLGQPIGTLLEL